MLDKSAQRVSELTQAARVANNIGRGSLVATNYGKALIAYDLSDDFLRRDQNLTGLPIQDQTAQVRTLLGENASLKQQSASLEAQREAEETGWRAERAQYEKQLIDMGQKYEAERNKSIVRRIISSLGIGGTVAAIVAICIFFPAAIPIFTHLAGWLVNKIPALASGLGVVSKNAFDGIVRGVESAKVELKNNPPSSPAAAADVLSKHLSKSMHPDHQVLVKARKSKIVAPIATS